MLSGCRSGEPHTQPPENQDRGGRPRVAKLIADDGPVAVTEPVITEVAAGAGSDDRETDLRRLLLRFHLLAFDAAASIYRQCRQVGVTPRGLIDCMIECVWARVGVISFGPLSDQVILDILGFRRVSQLGGVDSNFDRRIQVRGGSDRLGGELVDRVIFSEYAHRRNEEPQIDDLEMDWQSTHRLADR